MPSHAETALASTNIRLAKAQWLVITRYADNVTLLWVVLGIPALITAATVVRLLTVTVLKPTRRAGGRR